MKYIYLALTVINIVGFTIMGIDKLKAKKRAWRIPEFNLFIVASLGGAAGVLLGMYVFRHKTKHFSFVFGIPLLLVLNFLVAAAVYRLGLY